MSTTVIYAEKPDMARKIAGALGKKTYSPAQKSQGYFKITYCGEDYLVTWGYGHLCRLADVPEYDPAYKTWENRPMPFFPREYKIVLNEYGKAPVRQQYNVVAKLFASADLIINATDYDREGELIFYYVYAYSSCSAPVKRMKLASTTDEGIEDAFENLLPPEQFAGLLKSARCRSIADWVIGTNLTVAVTLQAGGRTLYSIGRVQTPTLRMIVDRDKAISNFKPEDYWTVDAVFTTKGNEKYKGQHRVKRFDKRADAQAVLSKCQGSDGIITDITRTQKKKGLPYLYNLSALQIEANKTHKFGAQKTLNIVQKLYEAGYVTYPRTDSRFLPEDMVQDILKIQVLLKNNGYGALFTGADPANMTYRLKHYFDNSKIGSHYAIIPTTRMPSGLQPDEQKIYDMIAHSVIRMQHKDAVLENVKVTTSVNGEPFISTGTTIIDPGWMIAGGTQNETLLPTLHKNDVVGSACGVTTRKTEPPKHYTEATLLTAMVNAGKEVDDDDLRTFMLDRENSGIGTEATRAGIIEILAKRGYTTKDKNAIKATPIGISLIEAIPVEDIKSVALTAKYERMLFDLAESDGKGPQASDFLRSIYKNITVWCQEIQSIPKERIRNMAEKKDGGMICPQCGKEIRKMEWGFGCSGYRDGCTFSIGKICGKKLTENQVKVLLSKGKVGPLSGFKRKDGSSFNGTLELFRETDEEGKEKCRVWFEERKSDAENHKDLNGFCPCCHSKMIRGFSSWECEDGCGFRIPYELCGREISKDEADTLLYHDQTSLLTGFVSKKGNPFSASLLVDKDSKNIRFVFPDRD